MEKVTQEQIDAWKAKYKAREITHIEIPEEDGTVKRCYLRPPDRKTLSYATSVAAKDPLKFNEILLKGCWIDGDVEIQTDDELFLTVSPHLSELVKVKEAKIEKL